MGRVISPDLPQRIGLVGDVHTESLILERCLTHLVRQGAGLLLCVGDVVDGPEEVNGAERACELLQEYDVQTVCGNHDRWLLEGSMRDLPDAIEAYELAPEVLAYLEQLPATRTIQTVQGPLLLCHGIGEDDMAVLVPPHTSYISTTPSIPLRGALRQVLNSNVRFVVNGHSHQHMVRELEGTLFINAGTLHREFAQSFAMMDFTSGEIVFYGLSPDASAPSELHRVSMLDPPQVAFSNA